MPLYHVTDTERSGFIIAGTLHLALAKWTRAYEKECDSEVEEPQAISLIADDSDIIIHDEWLANELNQGP